MERVGKERENGEEVHTREGIMEQLGYSLLNSLASS